MNMPMTNHLIVLWKTSRLRLTQWILAHRIRARHPDMFCDPSTIWDYGYADIDAIEIGRNVSVRAFAEILVYRVSPRSAVPGKLVLRDGAVISTGVRIRAAGGQIEIGKNAAVGQNCVVVAANHKPAADGRIIDTMWDEVRTGVILGDNVWVGANCTLLAGCRIGDGAIIAAGSVVRSAVPAGELWGGVPARRLRNSVTGTAP